MKKTDEKNIKMTILKAAKKEFAEKGFNGARMGEIAKRAGVYKSHINYYFENKEELYSEVVNFSIGSSGATELTVVGGRFDLIPPQKLSALLYFIINLMGIEDDGEDLRIFFWEIVEGRNNHIVGIETFLIPVKNLLAAIIKEGIEKEYFEVLESGEIDYLSMSILNSVTQYYLFKNIFKDNESYWVLYGNRKLEDRVDLMAAYLLKSLRAEDAEFASYDLPEDLQNTLDEMLNIIANHHLEGENINFINKISEILSIQI